MSQPQPQKPLYAIKVIAPTESSVSHVSASLGFRHLNSEVASVVSEGSLCTLPDLEDSVDSHSSWPLEAEGSDAWSILTPSSSTSATGLGGASTPGLGVGHRLQGVRDALRSQGQGIMSQLGMPQRPDRTKPSARTGQKQRRRQSRDRGAVVPTARPGESGASSPAPAAPPLPPTDAISEGPVVCERLPRTRLVPQQRCLVQPSAKMTAPPGVWTKPAPGHRALVASREPVLETPPRVQPAFADEMLSAKLPLPTGRAPLRGPPGLELEVEAPQPWKLQLPYSKAMPSFAALGLELPEGEMNFDPSLPLKVRPVAAGCFH